jgi:glucose-6-phosphate-specific signal transduction histidine kinase
LATPLGFLIGGIVGTAIAIIGLGDALGEGLQRTLELEVRDDGIGLPAQPRAGVGLHSMRERAEELGGVLVMTSGPGTCVSAYLPAPQMQEE